MLPLASTVDTVKCSRLCALRNLPVAEAKVTPRDCARCYSQEIVEGELVADDGRRFPIVGGIPRMLSGAAADFVRKNQQSFSLEWKYYRYGERNWGMDIESRKALFLKGLGKHKGELRGSLILDAGCGSGLLSMEMANSLGMEVVAMDLAGGIEKAYGINTNPFVHYIQGSVLEPPFRAHTFDYVYCAGVLIHLPSTEQGFKSLPPLLSAGGRLFVWVYHPIGYHRRTGDYRQERRNDWIRRRITSRLPIRLQELLYLALLIPYFLKRTVLNRFRAKKEDRSWREKMQNYVDSLSPINAHRHTEQEVSHWYRQAGLEEVMVSYNDAYGFGIRGDRCHAGTRAGHNL